MDNILLKKIDYSIVNNIIDNERIKTISYLKENL